MYKPGATTSSTLPTRARLPGFTACLSSHGYWYCHSHRNYLASTVGRLLLNGLRPFSYKQCMLCTGDTCPLRYIPLFPNQLRTAINCNDAVRLNQSTSTDAAACQAPSAAPAPAPSANLPGSQSTREAVPVPDDAPTTALRYTSEEEISQGPAPS